MKNVPKLLAAILLALALGAPAYAGDMPCPPSPPPPPPENSQAVPPGASDSQTPAAPDDIIDPTTVAFDLLYSLLSMY